MESLRGCLEFQQPLTLGASTPEEVESEKGDDAFRGFICEGYDGALRDVQREPGFLQAFLKRRLEGVGRGFIGEDENTVIGIADELTLLGIVGVKPLVEEVVQANIRKHG